MPMSCPAYHADTRLADLRTPELFVLTLLRLRAMETGSGSCPRHGDWRQGLETVKVCAEGMVAFEQLYDGVRAVATAEVRALRHPRVAPDEARLLRMVTLLQHRRYADVEVLMAEWLGSGARQVLRAAVPFAEHLARAGLTVPLRHCEAASVDLLACELQRRRGLFLVH